MTSSEFAQVKRNLAVLLLLTGCAAGDALLNPGLTPPTTVTATPLNRSTIRVDWVPGEVTELDRYRIERRVGLTGRFRLLADVDPEVTTYFDTGLDPATFYGYRVIAVSREGERSSPSVVSGARTAPEPSLRVATQLSGGTDPGIADPNGYRLVVEGPKDTTLDLGTLGQVTVTPLPAGMYTLRLRDVLSTCTIQGDTVRQIAVVDTGLATVASTTFDATCVDPTRGHIVARVTVAGDSLDPDGYRLEYAGIIPGDSAPVLGGTALAGSGGVVNFGPLRPGEYEVTLSDVDPPCQLTGPASRSFAVEALDVDTAGFTVTCPDKAGGNPGAPLIYRNLWTPQSSGPGQTTTLAVDLDLAALPTQDLGVIQAELQYDPGVLTFQSYSSIPGAALQVASVNSSAPGVLNWLALATTTATGVLPAARFTFQVAGAAGTRSITRTQIQLVANLDGTATLDTLFRVVEDTFTVGSGGGANQAPIAQAGGPYAGTAGAAIGFSSTGSADPDGSIASYSWTFGDGGTSGQAHPSHSYAAAGSYTATLTVTDNQGAQASDQATVTVSGVGGGNQPPVANPGGPYSGTAGANIVFSSAGSSDPDGSIVGYSWSFGDGGSSTEPNPTHGYAAAGSYTVTLTVTDNLGATGSAQAAVTVTAGSSTPFAWTGSFGGFEQVLGTYPLTITLNLTSDIPETTGPEALGSYTVDSLVWDPAVLEYHSLVFGSGGGSFNTTNATGGCKCKLVFNGSPTSNTGVVTVATVRFRPVGSPGSSTTTRTSLGPVLSTPALGSFNYRSRIQVVEGTVTLP